MLKLPVDDFIPQIQEFLQAGSNLVVTASPGAGKTTRIPSALLTVFKNKILVLEPRRMAAVAAADRIAQENAWTLGGDQIGYNVRFDRCAAEETRLVFLTEALLVRMMLENPELDGVDCIVLDEFHERNLHVDLALGLIKELQELGRNIQVVIMSATLEAEKIATYLGENTPILKIPGNLKELKIHYALKGQSLRTDFHFVQSVKDKIKEVIPLSQRDILVFLPGLGEISRVHEAIGEMAENQKIEVVRLHGSLDLAEQRRALQAGSRRRIILSTNIAESSVTIDGVDTVIDSGLEKAMHFDLKTGFSRLELGRISKSSAIQRGGRSARQYPGHVFKMWTKMDEVSMPQTMPADILRSDLSEALMFLSKLGVRDFANFSWFEAPTKQAIVHAQDELRRLGCLSIENELTVLGNNLLKFPLHPRLGKLLLFSKEKGHLGVGALIVALLGEKDIMPKAQLQQHIGDKLECDITVRLNYARHNSTIKKVAQQVCHLAGQKFSESDFTEKDVKRLLLHSFLDRLCRRRNQSDRGLMVGGRGVKLAQESLVRESEYFVALIGAESDQETTVRLACGFDKNFILEELKTHITKKQDFYFDEEKGKLYKREFRSILDLPIDEPTLSTPTSQEMQGSLSQICSQSVISILKQNEQLSRFKERIDYFHPDNDLFSQKRLKEIFDLACLGESEVSKVAQKDLVYFFESSMDEEFKKDFHKMVPDKLKMPSGSWIKVNYPKPGEAQAPFVEVRIQEVFGMTKTPKVMNDVAIAFHLLAPNYRPMQVTSDLESFWKNGYPEVRRELRTRYPKHSWPDDPLTAPAVAKGRPRG